MNKVKILIVEDEEIIALEIATRLTKMGFDICKTVTNGLDTVEEVKMCKPDIILMDIRIKGDIDGIETAKEIMSFTNIPIIYLTAHADQHTLDRAKETTPYGYLVKPVQERDLRITIEMALSKAKVEKELEKANKELEKERDLFSFGPVIVTVWLLEPGWPVSYVSSNVDKILGYTSGEWIQSNFHYSSLIHVDDIDMVTNAIVATISNGLNSYELSYRIRKKDNDFIWIYDYGKIVRDAFGNAKEIHGYMFNQTQLKKVTNDLEESEQKYRTVANYTYNWEYWMRNREFIYISPSVKRITGYEVEDFLSNPFLIDEIVYTDDRIEWLNHRCKISKEFIVHALDFRIVCKDGSLKWINHTCRIIIDDNGTNLGIRASNRDITLTKELESKLVNTTIEVEESERSRYSRELHDGLGPLLATIKLYFQWLSETNEKEKAQMLISKGLQNIEKAIETTRQVSRGLSSLQIDKEGFVNTFKGFIDDLSINCNVVITFNSNLNDRFNRTTELTLYRVATELVNNSLKYANAKSITISCDLIEGRKKIHFYYNDDGKGFNVEVQTRTSKGIGIPNIQSRVKALGGSFVLESGEGYGTSVTIELPYIEVENHKIEILNS
jgi:PAS domain S-box-containing protein